MFKQMSTVYFVLIVASMIPIIISRNILFDIIKNKTLIYMFVKKETSQFRCSE